MKKRKILIIGEIAILLTPTIVFAHPGRTDENGCHTCRTNCASYGLSNGEYHCHNNNTATNNDTKSVYREEKTTEKVYTPQTTKKITTTTTTTIAKSSNNSIKFLTIDNIEMEIGDEIEYSTNKDKIELNTVLEDLKATSDIQQSYELNEGLNTILLNVTAEDGTIKTYKLLVTKKTLSNNTNIKVSINNKDVIFKNNKGYLTVNHNTKELDIDYVLKDKTSNVNIEKPNNLKYGENYINIRVTSESGNETLYEITIKKTTKKEEITTTIFGFTFIGLIIFAIVKLYKKIRVIISKNKKLKEHRKCTKCGNDVKNSDKYCEKCGTKK